MQRSLLITLALTLAFIWALVANIIAVRGFNLPLEGPGFSAFDVSALTGIAVIIVVWCSWRLAVMGKD